MLPNGGTLARSGHSACTLLVLCSICPSFCHSAAKGWFAQPTFPTICTAIASNGFNLMRQIFQVMLAMKRQNKWKGTSLTQPENSLRKNTGPHCSQSKAGLPDFSM
jgi:hypothetical protein